MKLVEKYQAVIKARFKNLKRERKKKKPLHTNSCCLMQYYIETWTMGLSDQPAYETIYS